MTPAEVILTLVLGAGAAGVPLVLLLSSFVAFLLGSHRSPLLPPPPLTDEERKRQEEEDQLRRQEHDKRHRQEAEAAAARQAQAEARLAAVIAEVVSHVAFTAKRIQVGTVKTGQRAIGVVEDEVPYTSDDADIRPMRDLTELPQLTHAEFGQPPELMLVRIATGEAQVQTNIECTPVYEDVFEPAWEERRRVLYVLRDRSGSMFETVWRIPVWQGIVTALVRRSRQAEAVYLMRDFDDKVFDCIRVTTDEEGEALIRFVCSSTASGGTKIPPAIEAAIKDLSTESYDQADIVIVSDGEDQGGLNPAQISARLRESKIRLHAILLGANNDALRACADVYQIIQPDLTFQPPVRKEAVSTP